MTGVLQESHNCGQIAYKNTDVCTKTGRKFTVKEIMTEEKTIFMSETTSRNVKPTEKSVLPTIQKNDLK